VGFLLSGAYVAVKHIARGVYLSKGASAGKGFIAAQAFIRATPNSSHFESAKYDHQKPGV
jgi:hypothetical protein